MDAEPIRVLRGEVYRLKRIGPSTDPCGTPHERLRLGERLPLTNTEKERGER